MLNSATKRFILPFSPQKSKDGNYESELAAIYAVAELERSKGGGLIIKQPREKILFISKIGYPLWLFPKNENIYIFDGLNNTNFAISYIELPATKTFIDSLERNSKTKEDYLTFLSANSNYFQHVDKEKEISVKGLIANEDFTKELSNYRKEANEVIDKPPNLPLLSPTLEAVTITSALTEMDKIQSLFKQNTDRLPECQKQLSKITSQYVTELDYAAQAVKDEANAKIKAQEEFVNPKIAKLNSTYKQQIANVTRGFNEEIERVEKLKSKTLKSIESNEEKIKLYESEAKTQAEQNHSLYEKRWKEKKNQTKKENDGLKKELKRIENSIKNLSKQKTEKTWNLQKALETEIKLARQPLLDLETTRDAKMLAFKLEAEKLYKRIGDKVSYAYTLWSIGTAHKLKGSTEEAARYFDIADKLFKSTGDLRGRSYAALGRAELLWMQFLPRLRLANDDADHQPGIGTALQDIFRLLIQRQQLLAVGGFRVDGIADPEAAAQSLARALAPGGTLVAGYPMVNRFMATCFRTLGFGRIEDHHITTPARITAALRRRMQPVARVSLPAFAPQALSLYECTSWTNRPPRG